MSILHYCSPCHGITGEGDGPAARHLDTSPRDLTTGTFKYRSTAQDRLPTDGDLFRTIARGLPGTAMPSWGERLTERQIWNVVAYVKTFSGRFSDPQEVIDRDDVVIIPDEPPADAESVERGRRLYTDAGCAACHGEEGRGDGPAAGSLTDEKGRSITPRDHVNDPFRGGARSSDIYRTIAMGIAGTPMPAQQGLLTVNEIWDLVHYIESIRKPPRALDHFTDRPGDTTFGL